MKRIAITLCVILLAGLLCMPAGAGEDFELLENGDFEDVTTIWQKYYLATVDYCETAHTGNGAFLVTHRQHSTDIIRQYITKPLEYYGSGTYELSAWVRLADPEAQPIDLQIVVGVYCKSGEQHWFTTGWTTVTSEWTHVGGRVNMSWQSELDKAEFYLISPQNGDEDQSKNYRDLILDDCSMKVIGFAGEAYQEPTQAPVTTEPVTDAPGTEEPATEQTTAAPESTQPETEIVPEEDTTPESEQGSGSISAQTWVIAGTMAAVALILLCCGIALSVSYARGKRNEASK